MKKNADKGENPASYLDYMAGKTVLVIGDVMIDRFVYGRVDRMSPEAPVPVLLVDREEDVLGGAGNVLANLAGLKVNCQIIGVTGDDADAGIVTWLVEERGFSADGLLADSSRPTIVKTRFLSSGQHLIRADRENSAGILPAMEDSLYGQAAKHIEAAGAVILSDYGKGTLTRGLIARLITLAKDYDVPVLVDPKGDDYSKYEGASVVTPNSKELSQATGGMKTDSDDVVIAAARQLQKVSGIVSVVATRSQNGLSVFENDKDPVHVRATAQDVFDVTGAGDTVIATLASALAAGAPLLYAAVLANLAAGLVVAKTGTVAVCLDDLKEVAARYDMNTVVRQVA